MKLLRGHLVFTPAPDMLQSEAKGAVVIDDDGIIEWIGAFSALPKAYSTLETDDHGQKLICAGFIDAHIHFPQYRMLGAPAKDLLDWLNRYTFPEESHYGNGLYAAARAEIFLNRLFSHGTTAALAFCSVHQACAEALFSAAFAQNMALITGKTMMDRNAIAAVLDEAEMGARQSEALYKRWHGRGRLKYAVTPRFAVTSTEAQLSASGALLKSLDGALMQTHLSESVGEIAYVAQLFPNAKDYTDVYDTYGLLSERSLFAHGIHLSEREAERLCESGSSVVHCPTSNLFLGSGLLSFNHLRKEGRAVELGLATDIGGGTSYSMLTTMGETYKVQMLSGYKPTATELFYMATLGNAQRLHMSDATGSLETGKFADLVVLDPEATPVLKARQDLSQNLEDVLFSLALLGDDRAVAATYVAGRKVYEPIKGI